MCRPETPPGSGRMFHSCARWLCCQHPLAGSLSFVGVSLLGGLLWQQQGQGMPGGSLDKGWNPCASWTGELQTAKIKS